MPTPQAVNVGDILTEEATKVNAKTCPSRLCHRRHSTIIPGSQLTQYSQEVDWYFLGKFEALSPLVGSMDYAYRRNPVLGVESPHHGRGCTVYVLWLFGKVVVLKEKEHWAD